MSATSKTILERLREAQWDEAKHRHEFNKAINAGAPVEALEQLEEIAKLCGEAAVELEKSGKDAARYKHIRKRSYVAGNGWMFGGHYKPIAEYAYNLKGADAVADCDAAIDAALKGHA